jgi:uncharacterized Zn finger protein
VATTETKLDKATRLVEDGRVVFLDSAYAARVKGDHGSYIVTAFHDGIACSCPAGRFGTCSHSIAASIAWAEVPGGGIDDDPAA